MIIKNSKEIVSDFIERFESIVREFEATDDAEPLSSKELTKDLLISGTDAMPRIMYIWRDYRHVNGYEMSLKKLKKYSFTGRSVGKATFQQVWQIQE